MEKMLDEARDRGERGAEDAWPADDEPIIGRIDLTKGYVPGNVQIVSGLRYRLHQKIGETKGI
jgi:hypothetical protein